MQNGMYDTDDDLATRAAKGDEGSAARLYERYADRVYRIAYRVVLDEGLSKDVAQETWMKAFRHLKRFSLGSSFGAWVPRSPCARRSTPCASKNARFKPNRSTTRFPILSQASPRLAIG